MAVAIAITSRRRFLRGYQIDGTATVSGTYPTGGETINASDFGLAILGGAFCQQAGGFIVAMVPQSPDASGQFTSFKIPIYHDDSTSAGNGFVELSAAGYPSYVTTPNSGIIYVTVTGR